MKKKILAIAMILICISILASTTLAYFTDMGTARNVITTGGINVEVLEQQVENGVLKPYPADPISVLPGRTISKIVSVGSLEQSAWIRAAYTITVLDAQGNALDIPAADVAEAVIILPEAGKWTLKDGWFYYADPLGGGTTTSPLFTNVRFSGQKMGNEYQKCSIVVEVTAQAVQYANNGTSAMNALGWPTA